MLVLSRKQGETILIDGGIEITVVKTGNSVRLGISAPPNVGVLRGELNRLRTVETKDSPDVTVQVSPVHSHPPTDSVSTNR